MGGKSKETSKDLSSSRGSSQQLNHQVQSSSSSLVSTLKKRLTSKKNHASKTSSSSKEVTAGKEVATQRSSQVLRDFLVGWSTRDLLQLNEDYETTSVLKELYLNAENGRPTASSVADDLSHLFPENKTPELLDKDLKLLLETGLYSDALLVFESSSTQTTNTGVTSVVTQKCASCSDQSEYSCHSSVLTARSPFFANIVSRIEKRNYNNKTSTEKKMRIVLDESIIPRRFARMILHVVYRDSKDIMSVLPSVVCRCLTLFSLESSSSSVVNHHDLSKSTTTGMIIMPTNNPVLHQESVVHHPPPSIMSKSVFSSLFTSSSSDKASSSVGGHSSSVVSGSSSATLNSSSLLFNESNNTNYYVNEIMDLYEIARFLELESLIEVCEDLLTDSISPDNVLKMLKWSQESHGSSFVKRQCLSWIREEFSCLNNNLIVNLDHDSFKSIIRSDYVNAAEVDILSAVIKWGEHQLIKRMTDREPNVVSNTSHSINNVKKSSTTTSSSKKMTSMVSHNHHGSTNHNEILDDNELRDIISDLMSFVRTGHVLPLDSEVLTSAAKRGLLASLPPTLLNDSSSSSLISSSPNIESHIVPFVSSHPRGITSWLRTSLRFVSNNQTEYPPRLYSAFVEEAKQCLNERLARQQQLLTNTLNSSDHQSKNLSFKRSDSFIHSATSSINSSTRTPLVCGSTSSSSVVPDNLYMISSNKNNSFDAHFSQMTTSTSSEIYSSCFSQNNNNNTHGRRPHAHEGSHHCLEHHDQEQPETREEELPVLEQRVVVLMKQREAELKEQYSSMMSSSLSSRINDVLRFIRLRVVREFSLPDSAVVVLSNTSCYVPYAATETTEDNEDMNDIDFDNQTALSSFGAASSSLGYHDSRMMMAPPSGVLSNIGSNGLSSELQVQQEIYDRFDASKSATLLAHPEVPPLPSVPLRGETPVPPPLPPFSLKLFASGRSTGRSTTTTTRSSDDRKPALRQGNRLDDDDLTTTMQMLSNMTLPSTSNAGMQSVREGDSRRVGQDEAAASAYFPLEVHASTSSVKDQVFEHDHQNLQVSYLMVKVLGY